MKTLKQYFEELKIPEEELWNEVYVSEIMPEYDGFFGPIPGLKSYFAYSWRCTDTEVGLKFYFLNGEVVCSSFQPYRKSDKKFFWVSKETYNKVRDAVFELMKEDPKIELLNWDQDVSSIEQINK